MSILRCYFEHEEPFTADGRAGFCEHMISARMPDRQLPLMDWMLCSGNYKGRVRDPWELTYRWNTLYRGIVMLGGIFNVRKELGQDGGRRKWTRTDLVSELHEFYRVHDISPSKYEQIIKRRRNSEEAISEAELEIYKAACNLLKVCQNHGGYASIRKEAGLPDRFTWTRQELVKEIRAFFEAHEKTPSYYRHCIKIRIADGETVSETDLMACRKAQNLQNACHKHGGYASIRKEAGVPM